MRTTVYGASDDLIEMEGSMREEWGCYADSPRYLHLSDGTVLKCQHCPPELPTGWRIHPEKVGDGTKADTEFFNYV